MGWPSELTGTKFVIWAQIERADYDSDEYENTGEPRELGRFDTEEEAQRQLDTLLDSELAATAPRLLDACKALVLVASRMDSDLEALGKGRNLSSVPGFEGQDVIEAARAIVAQATGNEGD